MVTDVSKGRMYLSTETSGIIRPTRQDYILEYQNLERETYVRHSSMPTDGRTDRMTKLILAFRNFANTLKNSSEENRRIWAQKTGSERSRWKVHDEEFENFYFSPDIIYCF